MNLRGSRGLSVAAVVAAFSLLAAVNAWFHPVAFPDESDYWRLATSLAHSGTLSFDGITPSAYRPPLLAWALSPAAEVGLPMRVTRPLFVIFYAATGILAGVFLCRLFTGSRWIPALGTAFVLAHPLLFFAAGNLYPQQILIPLFMAALLLAALSYGSTRGVLAQAAAIGLITGASLLASAPAIFWLLPVFILLAYEDFCDLRLRMTLRGCRCFVALALACFCVTPYLWRNSRNVHPGIYLSLNSGLNLLLGNSPGTTPTSGVDVDLSKYNENSQSESEFHRNRRLTRIAVENIRSDPAHYFGLYLRKLCAGFSNTVETYTHGRSMAGSVAMWSYMTLVWVGCAIATLILLRGPIVPVDYVNRCVIGRFAIMAVAGFLFTIAGYALFFVRLRFRMPADAALALFAASGWSMFLGALATKMTGGLGSVDSQRDLSR